MQLMNFATGSQLVGPPDHLVVASAAAEPVTFQEICRACPRIPPDEVRASLRLLLKRNIVWLAHRARPKAELSMDALDAWNPEVGFFHGRTRHAAYGDPRILEPEYQAKAAKTSMRPMLTTHPGRPKISLPKPDVSAEFPGVLLARRTHRRFGTGTISRQQLGTLLGLTAGFHRFVETRPKGYAPLRTSPSGGARHPIDVYVVSLRTRGLKSGIYHYLPDRHELEHLKTATPSIVDAFLPYQAWFRDAAVLMVLVAKFSRTMFRYPHSRAYRAVLLEAGHLCQTFCLTSTWMGLAPFSTIGMNDERVEKDLGVDGISEYPVYLAGAGLPLRKGYPSATPRGVPPVREWRNPVFGKD